MQEVAVAAPVELPVIGAEPSERSDAARNRKRIVEAARSLFAERGVTGTSIDAIAAAAGVGKGTVFRRFGDRSGLALAVLDQSERDLQDAFMRGPAPLGPGAPPARRLIAFGEAMYDNLELNGEILADAERSGAGRYLASAPRQVHRMHVRALLGEAQPDIDLDYCTDLLLAPLSPGAFADQRRRRGMALARLKTGYRGLVERTTSAPPTG